TVKRLSIVVRLSGSSFHFMFLERISVLVAKTESALFNCVISGDLEKSGIGFAAGNVGQPICGFAHAWIAVFAQHDGLQFRRIPSLIHRYDGTLISDLAGGDGEGDACAFGLDSFNRLRA